jgi:ATP-dependent Lon protease
MPEQSSNLPPSFSGEVRLFPLPDLVMFPSNLLPLHIFESRYREMLEDAMQGDQLITMATLLRGFEHEHLSRPPIAPVVCIGQVAAHEKTDQGTYNLMLVGLRRARILYEIEPVRPYRRAKVQIIGDVSSGAYQAGSELGERLAYRVLENLPAAQSLVDRFIQHKISLASLTDVVAFHMPLAIDLKLRLLAEADAMVRAKLLLANLAIANASTRGNRRYPPEFSVN